MAVTLALTQDLGPTQGKVDGGRARAVKEVVTTSASKHLFVPDGKLWVVQSGQFKLTTSGDAANRQVELAVYDDKRVEQYFAIALNVQIASTTERYALTPNAGGGSVEAVALYHGLNIPRVLLPNWQLSLQENTTGSDDGTQSTATLTIAEPVTAADTFTINNVTFTLVAALTAGSTGETANEILIGASEAATKTNINAALGATPSGYGTLHTVSDATRISLNAHAVDFSGDDMVWLAFQAGSASDAIDTTETFTHASNVFGGAVFASGVDADDAGALTLTVLEYSV